MSLKQVFLVFLYILSISQVYSQIKDQRYYVSTVYFEGNKTYSDRRLQKIIRLKDPFLFKYSEFNRRSLKLDAITLKNFYASEGFLSTQVRESFKITGEDRVEIYFEIVEGVQSMLKSFTIQGIESLTEKKIKRYLSLETGEPFNPIRIQQSIQELQREYQKIGKLHVQIDESYVPKEEIDLQVVIQEGPTVKISDIIIEGLVLLDTSFVERELVFQSGSIYNIDLIEMSQRRIFETGLFSIVNIFPVASERGEEWVNIHVEVKEFTLREFLSDGGYYLVQSRSEGAEPVPGLGITGELRDRSLFGLGMKTGIKASIESPIRDVSRLFQDNIYGVELNLSQLWILGIRLPTNLRFYYKHGAELTLAHEVIDWMGADLTFERIFSRKSTLRGGLRWINVLTGVASEIENEQESGFRIYYRYRNTDHPLFPTKGTYFSIQPWLVGSFLGGTRDYYRIELDYRRYYSNRSKWILALRTKLGRMEPLTPDSDEIPDLELFYLGGSTSLRGWRDGRFREFKSEDGTITAEGGVIKLLVNCEVRIPLSGLFSMNIFIDGGILAKDRIDFNKQRKEWVKGNGWNTGLELSIASPLGPVRISYAVPLNQAGGPLFSLGLMNAF
ncbi:MAG: outer membrane protein assembly factor [Fidelibacterota bacterium]